MAESVQLNLDMPFMVGHWHVDPHNNQIRLGDNTVKLEPKVMDVLVYLAARPGQVVSREELEDNVWSGRIVTYDALTATIVKLRKAFQSDNNQDHVIKTIPKRGYCLVAPITPEQLQQDSTAHPTTTIPAETIPDASPPTQESSIPGNTGSENTTPHAAITRRLPMITVLVIMLALLLLYRLNNTVPEGTTHQDAGDKNTAISSAAIYGGTTDLEAQNAFNAGWHKFLQDTPADYKTAIALLDRATVLDPDYGQAHAALAAVYWNTWKRNWHILVGTEPMPHTWELADASLQQALQHPTPLAYQVASEMLSMNRRHEEAVTEARKAISIAPNNPVGHAALARALVFSGSYALARKSIDKAMQINPNYPSSFLFILGLIHFHVGDYDKAAAVLEQAIRSNPNNHLIYIPLIAAYGHLGHRQLVAAYLEKVNKLRKLSQLPLLNVSTIITPYPYNTWPFREPDDISRLQEGLRAAGLPEW